MATNFNKASVFNQHQISFHPRAMINGSTGAIPGLNSVAMNSGLGVAPCTDVTMLSSVTLLNTQPGSSAAGLLDSVAGSSHDTDLAVEWSSEEQSRLERGLAKYADIPNMWKYIKIAAMLPEKTVRDVAMRCRWMKRKENGKRRKPEGNYLAKKEKMVESFSKSSMLPPLSVNMASCPSKMHQVDKGWISTEGMEVGSTTWCLLDENAQILSRIMTNLENFKIQENIDLFFHTRKNIVAILNNMREMPGLMSQMPPLPVSINEELAIAILPKAMLFTSPGGVQDTLKLLG